MGSTRPENMQEFVDDDDEEDGPPPGFQSIITSNTAPHQQLQKAEDEHEDEEGPPPGFAPRPMPLLRACDMEMRSKEKDIEDEEDGPPPGWELTSLSHALPSEPSSNATDVKVKSNDGLDEDEGPPPGWETNFSHQPPQLSTSPLQLSSIVPPNIEMGSKEESIWNEGPVTMADKSPLPTPPATNLPSSSMPPSKVELDNKKDEMEKDDKVPTSGGEHMPPPQQRLPPMPLPSSTHVPSSHAEKAQLVCGTCQKLLLYPRGAKWVQCPSCQEVNLVLEEHQVGQVKCGGCDVLLMYPYGAPAVRCSSCFFLTEIGAQNRRPPLSVQQARRRRFFTRTR